MVTAYLPTQSLSGVRVSRPGGQTILSSLPGYGVPIPPNTTWNPPLQNIQRPSLLQNIQPEKQSVDSKLAFLSQGWENVLRNQQIIEPQATAPTTSPSPTQVGGGTPEEPISWNSKFIGRQPNPIGQGPTTDVYGWDNVPGQRLTLPARGTLWFSFTPPPRAKNITGDVLTFNNRAAYKVIIRDKVTKQVLETSTPGGLSPRVGNYTNGPYIPGQQFDFSKFEVLVSVQNLDNFGYEMSSLWKATS